MYRADPKPRPVRARLRVIKNSKKYNLFFPFPSFAWKGLSVGLYHLKMMISKPVSGLLSPHLENKNIVEP